MSEDSNRYLARAMERLKEEELQAIKTKEFINRLLDFEGLPPRFTDLGSKSAASLGSLRSDQFYGRPLATVVREILEMRRAAGLSAASVTELYNKLIEGGFRFETANDENAKRSLRISLTKNPAFHKIPNGDYGLSEWYPVAKQAKKDKPENGNGHDVEPEPEQASAAEEHDPAKEFEF